MESNIITQENLLNGFEIDVFEASLDQGQVRSDKPDADVQGAVIVDQGIHSKYKVQALLKTCIHGIWDGTSKTPTSLIVVEYSLSNLEEQGRFSSVTTSFVFEPWVYDPLGPGHKSNKNLLHTPSVVAFAPFESAVHWNETTADEENKHTFDAAIEPEASGVKAGKIGYSYENSSSHQQRYFSRGLAGVHYVPKAPARDIPNHVWWNMQHNFSQKSGVPPKFRTAILVTRPDAVGTVKFLARFNIAVRGGNGMRLENLVNHFLGRSINNKPVVFDPKIKFMGKELNGIKPNDDGDYELGHLAQGQELVKLSEVWGLGPLLQE